MMWDDLAARARGLATHLFSATQLDGLDTAPHLGALVETLRQQGYLGFGRDAPASAFQVEKVARRRCLEDQEIIARWAGERVARLAVVFEAEDRRSLRGILRGIQAGLPTTARLQSTRPSPSLSEPLLGELARQPSVARVAALLALFRHPFAEPLSSAVEQVAPEQLLELEQALSRCYAERALRAAGRISALRAHVKAVIDLENLASALLVSPSQSEPERFFLVGGARIGRDDFLKAAALEQAAAAEALSRHFLRTPVLSALEARQFSALDRAGLELLLGQQRELSRHDPTGPAAVLRFLLQRQWELLRVQHAAWRLTLTREAA